MSLGLDIYGITRFAVRSPRPNPPPGEMNCVFRRFPSRLNPSFQLKLGPEKTTLPSKVFLRCSHLAVTRSFTSGPYYRESDASRKARSLSSKGVEEEEKKVKARQNQIQRPWLREDADKPPVDKSGGTRAQPLTKGTVIASFLVHCRVLS